LTVGRIIFTKFSFLKESIL